MCESCLQYISKAEDAVVEMRGKSFLKQIELFANLMDDYWPYALKQALALLEDNARLEKPRDTIHKATDDMEVFIDDVTNRLAISYKLGQKYEEKQVQKQLSIDISFAIKDDVALSWAKTRAGELIKGIDAVTLEEVQSIVFGGITDQKPIKEIAQELEDKFSQYKGYRSQLIAQMEVTNAFSHGKEYQFAQYTNEIGVPGWKRSLTQGDERVRPEHTMNAEKGWIPYIQEFPYGGLNRMREPFDFNCRCVVQYSIFNPDTESIF